MYLYANRQNTVLQGVDIFRFFFLKDKMRQFFKKPSFNSFVFKNRTPKIMSFCQDY